MMISVASARGSRCLTCAGKVAAMQMKTVLSRQRDVFMIRPGVPRASVSHKGHSKHDRYLALMCPLFRGGGCGLAFTAPSRQTGQVSHQKRCARAYGYVPGPGDVRPFPQIDV